MSYIKEYNHIIVLGDNIQTLVTDLYKLSVSDGYDYKIHHVMIRCGLYPAINVRSENKVTIRVYDRKDFDGFLACCNGFMIINDDIVSYLT